ncbi:hypothetical protein MEG05_07690 [Vibrio aestuarianus]|uniref:hypothetical protein n=1 Tax=Vibrio aestuarianus TaxID=28171 RepID=UPI00237C9DBE|nr:hypothetical protein [Vibrio aestuarianus]MDE1314097.1 hypothetical protein [Vibrio aestuarianus]
MAAEKLTKHRLAQITITLIILVGAFIWRTLSYNNLEQKTCNPHPNCSVFVNGEKITIVKSADNPLQLVLSPFSSEVYIQTNGIITHNADYWLIQPNSLNSPVKFSIIEK